MCVTCIFCVQNLTILCDDLDLILQACFFDVLFILVVIWGWL